MTAGPQESYVPMTQNHFAPSCKSWTYSYALPEATAPLSSTHTFQYLSGLHLSHILLTHTFYILFIFPHNQSLCPQVNCSALLSPFFTLSSSPRAGAPQTQTPVHRYSLCSLLRSTGLQQAWFGRLPMAFG